MRYIATFFILFVLSLVLHAQPVTSVKYDQMIDVAETAAANYDYKNAIDWFNKAYKESKDKNLKVAVGDLYMKLRDYSRAERTYGIILKRDKDSEYQDIVMDYIKALRYQGKNKEAVQTLKAFSVGVQDDSLKQLALQNLKELEALENLNENIDIVVRYIESDVNSGSAENSPMLGADGSLYYSSFDRKTTIDLAKEEEDYHAQIFRAVRNEDGSYGNPEVLEESVNRRDYHSSGVSFSADGRTMYFTRVRLEGNEVIESDIYTSTQKDDGWSGAQPIATIRGDYLLMHPYEGELYGDKVLFFASDMDGGYGGYDLYYSKISGGEYGAPINLGESVNTPADEITPSYHNGNLYFSTNGRGGMGGYDIFKTRWTGETFADITNMGKSYNSHVDDTYFRLNPDGKSGYLVSNRPSDKKRKFKGSDTCCDDIYSFQKQEIVIDLLTKVLDKNGNIDGATVDLIDLTAMDDDAISSKTNLNSNEFKFLLATDHKYRLKVSREGYLPDSSIIFNTGGILDNFTITKEVVLQNDPNYGKDGGGGETIETQVIKTNETVRLNNIYYDFNKWDILPSAEEDLSILLSLMSQYPSIVIELSSHTDSRGKTPYNQKLSQKRAESAKSWLVDRGVDPNRIKAVGYGESRILNRCVNGVRCSDGEHAINRRTEFKVLEGPETIIIERKKKRKAINLFDKYKDEDDYQGSKNNVGTDSVPAIKFVENNIDLGDIVHGDSREVVFHFVNTGNAPLNIRLVTACKCTDLNWTRTPVLPGESGMVKAVYHTKDQAIGEARKTLDIIANTDPIVVEAFFQATIVPQDKKDEVK